MRIYFGQYQSVNEVVPRRKYSVNIFNVVNHLRGEVPRDALASARIHNADSDQKKEQKSPKLLSVEYDYFMPFCFLGHNDPHSSLSSML